jgi:hypothetical protein
MSVGRREEFAICEAERTRRARDGNFRKLLFCCY